MSEKDENENCYYIKVKDIELFLSDGGFIQEVEYATIFETLGDATEHIMKIKKDLHCFEIVKKVIKYEKVDIFTIRKGGHVMRDSFTVGGNNK